jgi:hypothetical protein
MPQLDSYAQFRGHVALGALAVVQRELEQRAAIDARARDELAALLDTDGSLDELEPLLCDRIGAGALGTGDAALMAYLRRTTMARLAIDQPKYPSYVAALARERARVTR